MNEPKRGSELPAPPRALEWLLALMVPPGPTGKTILGDLREEFVLESRSGTKPGRATLNYLRSTLSVAIRRPGTGGPPTPEADNDRSLIEMLGNVLFDLKKAFRVLIRRPGLTLAAVISLGLGIGANTGIFSVVNAVLLEPLPYPNSEELMGVYRIDPNVTGPNPTPERLTYLSAVPYEVYQDWARMSPVFESAGAYAWARLTETDGDAPLQITGVRATSGVFAALGVSPQIGRYFLPEDDAVGAPQAIILGHGVWQSRYGEDPGVLGQTMKANGESYTIIGVMPEKFDFPWEMTEAWITFDDDRKSSTVRNGGYLQVIARLQEGIGQDEAQREMDAVARRIGETHPEEVEHGIGLFSSKELVIGNARSALFLFMGAVALVLLIACTNIAGLLLVRATERRREMGIRRAIGGGGGRLVFQNLSEALILSFFGGLLGWGLAAVGLRPFLELLPGGIPRVGEIRINSGLFFIATGFALLTGVLTGILPALRAARTPITNILGEGSRGSIGGRSGNRTQSALVVSQITLALLLLTGAGVFLQSLRTLLSVDLGFSPEGIAVAQVSLPVELGDDDQEGANAYIREVERRLGELPGVMAVGAADQMPMVGGFSMPPVSAETQDEIWDGTSHVALATPGYFQAMGIPLLSGRSLSEDDRQSSDPVVVVSQSFAEGRWPDQEPLGRRVRLNIEEYSEWRTVVGVVGDVLHRVDTDPFAMFYLPYAQLALGGMHLVVKSSVDPGALVQPIRETLTEANSSSVVGVEILEERIQSSQVLTSARFTAALVGIFAVLASFLAVMGVYGVLAYMVQLRSREIGIQLALGAEKALVLRTVLGRGLVMAGGGVVLGTLLSLAVGRVVRGMLFEVSPTNPAALAAAGILLTVAVLAASLIPARRAAGFDPVEILKGD